MNGSVRIKSEPVQIHRKERRKMELMIGNKIKNLRKQKNISQEVLAQYLGISFQAVSKWESGDSLR